MDITQTTITAVSAAVVSSLSASATLVVVRYFPRVLDKIERAISSKVKRGDR